MLPVMQWMEIHLPTRQLTGRKNLYWSVDLGMDILIDHLFIRNTYETNGELLNSDLLMSI